MSDSAAPVASVIIPARNAASSLPRQIEALARQELTGPFEVVVVDHRSTDGTADAARAAAPPSLDLHVVAARDGDGVNHARNVGAAAARGRLLLYVDADDEVADGWLAAMVGAAEDADVLGGALDQTGLNPEHTLRWQPVLTADGLPCSLGYLPYAVGANVGIRAEVLRALGGWDESFVCGANDVDLSWRAQQAGYRLAFVPDAVVRYQHRDGTLAVMVRACRHDRANAQLYKRYRDRGARGRTWGEALRGMLWLGRHLPDLGRGRGVRENWFRELGGVVGRSWGSVEHRVRYL